MYFSVVCEINVLVHSCNKKSINHTELKIGKIENDTSCLKKQIQTRTGEIMKLRIKK